MLEEDLGLGFSQCGLNGELSLESYCLELLVKVCCFSVPANNLCFGGVQSNY